MFKQTIKTNILTIFLLLLAIVSASLLISQYYFSHKLAISSTQKNFELITNNLINKIKNESKQIHRILDANIDNKQLFSKINFEHNPLVIEDLTEIMTINPTFYAIYFAHKDGSFFEIINMKEDSSLYDFYKAEELTRWTVIVAKDNKKQYTF